MNFSKYLFAATVLFSFNSIASDFLTPFNDENGAHFVQIRRDSLGKEFLIHRYIAPLVDDSTHAASASAMGQDLIVHFVSSGNAVHMLGSTEDITVDTKLRSKMLLAEFPIVKRDNDFIVFDFNKGMNKHFSVFGLHDGHAHVSTISQGYISQIESTKSGLHITQVVQYEVSEGYEDPRQEKSQPKAPKTLKIEKGAKFGEIQYLVYPYQANDSFVTSDSKGHRNAFFQTTSVKRAATSGRLSKLNLKWDLSKGPIRFHISANMPEQFRKAAKEGVLYWNLAFGQNIMEVADAPLDVVAPSMDINMIQWVDSDAATTAYGDMAHDPRTGEIKRAHVFLTSGNIRFHEARLRALYRVLSPLRGIQWQNTTNPFYLAQVASVSSPYALDRMLEDAVRHLVAHEVGHTLGLRHNFLASMASTLSEKGRHKMFLQYMHGASPSIFDGVILTTSLMEYLPVDVNVMVGAQIRNALTSSSGTAMRFDENVIRRLYFGEKVHADFVFACIDEHVGQYIDCKRHDFAADIIVSAHTVLTAALKNLPVSLAEEFIEPKIQYGPEVLPGISISAMPPARERMMLLADMLAPLNDANRMASVEASFGHDGETNEEAIKARKRELVRVSLRQLGGIENAFFFMLPPYRNSTAAIADAESSLDAYLTAHFQGFGAGGVPYHFPPAELAIVRGEIKAFLPLFEVSLRKAALAVLADVVVSDPEIGLGFENAIARVVAQIALSTTDDQVIESRSPADPNNLLRFRKYTYDLETRIMAIRLLYAKVANGIDWSSSARKNLAGSMMSVATLDASTFREHPKFIEIRKRIAEAGEIVKALSH